MSNNNFAGGMGMGGMGMMPPMRYVPNQMGGHMNMHVQGNMMGGVGMP